MDPLQILILKKQYEILALLDPGNKDHELSLKAIDSGFELEIEALIEGALIEPVSVEICKEVRSILDMFRNLQNSFRQNGADAELIRASLFPGFDGNEESDFYSYALYLLEDKGLWKGLESRDNTWNSHHPTVHGYRLMLAEFKGVGKFPYTNEAVERVLAARLER